MAWLILIIAGLFEVVWAFSMKQSEGLHASLAFCRDLDRDAGELWAPRVVDAVASTRHCLHSVDRDRSSRSLRRRHNFSR